MQCHQCQHENPDGSRFCNTCGHNLATTTSLVQSEPRPVAEAERSPLDPSLPEAERRQLTVMFCDLVGSTSLSDELDPEELREVVRAYQATCTEVIQRYDGHVAQHLGDGLLVYFGYPQAHEDDPQRAVHTGLGIIESLKHLNVCLAADNDIHLSVRVGIHTGLVVVGQIGSGDRQEQLALGAAPNVAARIQGLAEPDTLIISHATYQLVQGYFNCDSLGEHDLRGVTQPIAVYQVLGDSGIQNRLDIASTRGLTPLVGRESESTLLFDRWEQVKDRQGQVILLSGEAGIGKSRLVQVLKDYIASAPHTRWECRSSPYYQHTALYPLVDFFQRALHWHQDDTPEEKLARLEQGLSHYRLPVAETVPLFATLLSLSLPEDSYPPLSWTPQRQRQKTLETIVIMLLKQAEQQPVLFIVEDLHWTDPTTLDCMNLLIDHTPTAALYVLFTCRPEFQPPWSHRSYLTEITVKRLSREQITRMATHVAGGKLLPDEVLQRIVDKTDGVPLFVEEQTKAVLESGVLKEANGHYEMTGSLSALAMIPATLHDSLMARLDRLVSAKGIAQLGAVMGRQFSYALLEAVSQLDPVILQRELVRLVDAELLYQRGLPPQATYVFKHALIQDAAYQSLLKSSRQQYHQRIAKVLEAQFLETVETQPELLAHHYTEGGLGAPAVDYWQCAGERAIARSGYMEAISHLTTGLEVLHAFPDIPEHARRELALYTALGVPLQATRGWAAPETRHAYARARELCQQMGDTSQLFPILRGLWRFYQVSGEVRTAYELAEQSLRLAQSTQDPSCLLLAHESLGTSLFQLGEIVAARTHYEHGLAFYTPEQHHALVFRYGTDPGVACLIRVAVAQWVLGYPDQALQRSHEALTMARELSHSFTLMYTLAFATMVLQFRREGHTAQEWAEALIALSIEQGFAQGAVWGRVLRGWALRAQGQGEEGITEMHQGLIHWRALRVRSGVQYCLTLLAEAYGAHGQVEEGLRLLAEALEVVHETGERFHEAELYRIQGDLLLGHATADAHQVETCFQQALAVARRQQAKSLELRAATSLARLWQQQGKRQDAYDLLAPVYNWFTEGFKTADLQDAKSLLDELEK